MDAVAVAWLSLGQRLSGTRVLLNDFFPGHHYCICTLQKWAFGPCNSGRAGRYYVNVIAGSNLQYWVNQPDIVKDTAISGMIISAIADTDISIIDTNDCW